LIKHNIHPKTEFKLKQATIEHESNNPVNQSIKKQKEEKPTRRAEARTLAAGLVTGAAFGEAGISQGIKRPSGNGGERLKMNGARNELCKRVL